MTDASTILRLDRSRRDAMLGADGEALAALLDDGVVWIHGNGNINTKEEILDYIGNARTKYLSIDRTEEDIRFLGGLAFISGVEDMKVEVAEGVLALRNRFTVVWEPAGEESKIINCQFTSMREPALQQKKA
ncbi:nuclear transport factor 2 family protein [Streptomyces prunicolor]|uniref:nuclear transport factor 2 family protein n=1 Tax=Streptomyces prunicolor TaxID=67348 RepID=UPI0034260BDB